ncbi:class D sortase [Litoribacterium kuwaitense]|uniref:class D sortase n=1 Tax=Litoribacterium kuwaitense TaxID=1398745 RepID=UPI001FECB2F6|nr:class D sortase [Litoribacterium kuwaitense]
MRIGKWVLAFSSLIAGAALIFYPIVQSQKIDAKQSELLNTLAAQRKESNSALDAIFQNGPPVDSSVTAETATSSAIAQLTIPGIEANMPVVNGASLEDMKYAAGRMKGTAPIGSVGNAAVAAHRSFTEGQFFNRLDEVKDGDQVIVQTADETYIYIVEQTTRVLPNDVSVLEPSGESSELTLITCDPMINPTHRLIVKAKLAEKPTSDALSDDANGGTQ